MKRWLALGFLLLAGCRHAAPYILRWTFALALVVCLYGCRTRLTGGSTQSDSLGAYFETHPDGTFSWRDTRDHTATTQPSVEASDSQAFKVLPTKDGMFAGISVEAAKNEYLRYWPLVVLLAVAGILAIWPFGQWLAGIFFLASAALVAWSPIWAAIIGFIVLCGALARHLDLKDLEQKAKQLKQVVTGAAIATESLPPPQKALATLQLKSAQDHDTSQAVDQIRATIDPAMLQKEKEKAAAVAQLNPIAGADVMPTTTIPGVATVKPAEVTGAVIPNH